MEIIRLPQKEFWDLYLPRCKPIKSPPQDLKQAVRTELDDLDKKVRSALAQHWEEETEYQLNDDWNVCWHHSMGVYSQRILCRGFLEKVAGVLASMPHEWTFHVACEPFEQSADGSINYPIGTGQLFFIRDKVYFDTGSDLNYDDHFTKHKLATNR